MQSNTKLVSRVLIIAALLFSVLFWLAAFFRWTALIFAFACIITLPFLSIPRRQTALNVLLIGSLALSLLPVDISFRTRPGPPKFVRVVYGWGSTSFYNKETGEEVISGGCTMNGYVPTWVLVW